MSAAPTIRTEVRRLPKRAVYETARIYAILDEGVICHVGFVVDGQPYVMPTGYARVEDELYLHGSPASRMLRTLGDGIDCCVTVTLLDGFVLARSAFHHSMNYRSVVAFGTARKIADQAKKLSALRNISEHLIRGRWEDVRTPTERELKATSVLEFDIEEASAKVRQGPPLDDEPDYVLPVWAGVAPLHLQLGTPVPDARLAAGIALPGYLKSFLDRH